MSDYDDSRVETSDDEEENEIRKESDDEEENNEKEIQQYNSDGLTNDEYRAANMLRGQLIRADCCQRYFSQEGYVHKTKYGLNFAGMNTCIHCYFRLNEYKLSENSDITPQEIECLKYYINNFVEEHQPSKCGGTNFGGKCVLCDAIRGVYPPVVAKDMIAIDEIVNDDSIGCADNDDIYNDIRIIKRSNILSKENELLHEQTISRICSANTTTSKDIKKDQKKPFVLIL